LLDLFPSVKAKVLLEIARHEFEPSNLYKLDLKYRDKAGHLGLDFNGKTLTLQDPTTKDYPSFHSLFTPLTTYIRETSIMCRKHVCLMYFDILVAFAATSGIATAAYHVARGSYRYLAQLETFHDKFQWSAVLHYHMEFHHERLCEMSCGDYSQWEQIDMKLQARYLVGRERTR
ncbi:hypothetical protein K466DRAFT_447233, partial [Polyporus arcularius HHB13444]